MTGAAAFTNLPESVVMNITCKDFYRPFSFRLLIKSLDRF